MFLTEGALNPAGFALSSSRFLDCGFEISNTSIVVGTGEVSGTTIRGCDFQGDLEITAGGQNVITGNACNGFDVTTDATGGKNVIVGNTNTGTITSHATDAATGNS